MMTTAGTTGPPRGRRCGAEALARVLTRHQIPADRERLWAASAADDPFGGLATRSFRLAALAIRYGLEAAVLQCHAPRAHDAIRDCHRHGVSVIVNHQTPWARDEGHYSCLVGIDHDTITLHDPTLDVQVTHPIAEFLSLWQPNREATGFVLIAIGDPKRAADGSDPGPRFRRSAADFADPVADKVRCPRCGGTIRLCPASLFRPEGWSPEGWWRRFFCTTCDAGFAPRKSNRPGVVGV